MRRPLCAGLVFALLAVLAIEKRPARAAAPDRAVPEYASDGKLVRPAGYRKWVFLSSGYGMSYSDSASNSDHQMFTNVFVPPGDYDFFLEHGRWPDKTIFVLELYGSQSEGSINQHGHFQTELMGLDVEVKDGSRFPEQWAYFAFDASQPSSQAMSPAKNDCWK